MIVLEGYDRGHALSADELHHMQALVARFQEGGKGWHKTARPALRRLLHPLEDVLDHLGAVDSIKTQVHDQDHRHLSTDTSDGSPRAELLGVLEQHLVRTVGGPTTMPMSASTA